MNISLKKMLPILDDEQLEELTSILLEAENKKYKDISLKDLLPFIDDSVIDKVLFTLMQRQEEYTYVLPFVSDETMHNLTLKIISGEIDIDLDPLYPFLSDKDIKLLFKKAIEKDI